MQTYIKVIELKSFTKASRHLNMSQPSVSFHIRNLEEYFQTTLIDRSPKRFQPTQTGEIVYERARQMLGILQKARVEVQEYHNQIRGTIRIGASYTVGEYILPYLLKAFDETYPSVDLNVTIKNTEQINRGILHHELDIGLVEGKVDKKELSSFPFKEDEMVIVVPEFHPLRDKGEITFDDLQSHTWVSREEGSGTRAVMESILANYNISPGKIITIGSNHGVIEGVKQGLGLSVISRTVVEQSHVESLILPIPFIKTASRFFSCVFPVNEREISKNVSVFIQLLENFTKEL